MPDGSIRVAEATEDSLGTYTCVPYNALGTMGMSPPATLVLKVPQLLNAFVLSRVSARSAVTNAAPIPQDPPYFNVRPGGEYRQEAGRELVIPCAASGDPDIPTITWRKVQRRDPSSQHTPACLCVFPLTGVLFVAGGEAKQE